MALYVSGRDPVGCVNRAYLANGSHQKVKRRHIRTLKPLNHSRTMKNIEEIKVRMEIVTQPLMGQIFRRRNRQKFPSHETTKTVRTHGVNFHELNKLDNIYLPAAQMFRNFSPSRGRSVWARNCLSRIQRDFDASVSLIPSSTHRRRGGRFLQYDPIDLKPGSASLVIELVVLFVTRGVICSPGVKKSKTHVGGTTKKWLSLPRSSYRYRADNLYRGCLLFKPFVLWLPGPMFPPLIKKMPAVKCVLTANFTRCLHRDLVRIASGEQ